MVKFSFYVRAAFCYVLFMALTGKYGHAQIHLVKDLYAGPLSSYEGISKKKLVVGPYLYFEGTSNMNGKELWRTDGTEAGTLMVRDINPGVGSSRIREMTNVNGTLYFVATTPQHGQELWRSDGSPEGTVMVKDIHEGSSDTEIWGPMAVLNNNLFFFVKQGGKYQLWMSAASGAGGTSMLKEFSANDYNHYLTVSGKSLYFAANTGSEVELWKSDGTAENTVLVDDIGIGTSSVPMDLTNVNGMVYFSAYTSAEGREIWRSDGTSVGSWNLRGGTASSNPTGFVSTGGNLYFLANDGSNGEELWIYVPATDRLSVVENIGPGAASASIYKSGMTGVNGSLYFEANDGTHGTELWRSDGTEAGTFMVADMMAQAESGSPSYITLLNGRVYFSATTATYGRELYRTDGTPGNVEIVKDLRQDNDTPPAELVRLGNNLCFWAYDDVHGYELWISDGTSGNTRLIKDIAAGTDGTSLPEMANINGTLYFTNFDDGLLKTDGTEAGTVTVAPYDHGYYKSFTATTGGLYYVLNVVVNNHNTNKFRLYKSNGSVGGDIALTADLVSIKWPKEINGVLYFVGNDGVHGEELWTSNGTVAGTRMVKDINPGPANSTPRDFTFYKNALYFTATDNTYGNELWKCEGGTELGTARVKDINPGPSSSYIDWITEVNGILYYRVHHSNYGYQLGRSDGTEAGTTIIVTDPTKSSVPGMLLNLNNTLYFVLWDATDPGQALWKSDGTEGGTSMVVNPSGSIYISDLIKVGDTMYFITEHQLWKSDGTAQGTELIIDLGKQEMGYLFQHNGHVFFTSGGQLWKSNGDICTTIKVNNENEVTFSGDYATPVGVGDKLYFPGISKANGLELFYYDFSTIHTPGCTQTIDIASIDQKKFGDQPFTIAAVASSGLPVTFTSSNPEVATITGNTVMIVAPGEVTFTATQAGSNKYAPASAQTTITINKATATLSLTSTEHLHTGSPLYPEVTTTPAGLSGIRFTFRQNGNVVSAVDPGEYAVEVTLDNKNYQAAPVNGTFVVRLITALESGLNGIVKVYPNPVTEFLLVEGEALKEGMMLELRNADGKSVSPGPTNTTGNYSLDMRSLSAGIYYLSVSNGKTVTTLRIVKK